MSKEPSVVFHTVPLRSFDEVGNDVKFKALLKDSFEIKSTFVATDSGNPVVVVLMVKKNNPLSKQKTGVIAISTTSAIVISLLVSLLSHFI